LEWFFSVALDGKNDIPAGGKFGDLENIFGNFLGGARRPEAGGKERNHESDESCESGRQKKVKV
jgi:hypothetical protein